MKLNLPVAALRSFVAIATEGSMIGAAGRVFLTQSALSLQIKRLEDLLQVTLFHRQGRTLVLSADGKKFLEFARQLLEINDGAVETFSGRVFAGPVRVGVVQDFAEALLSETLAGFARDNPAVQLHIRVAGSKELRELVASDALDLALYLAPAPSPVSLHDVPMRWLGADELMHRDVLPLALLEEPCLFRATALAALEKSGRPYQIVMETQSLSALSAAVVAGMAVTCRTPLGAGAGLTITSGAGLPSLPQISLVLDGRETASEPARRLRELITGALLGEADSLSAVPARGGEQPA